MKLNTDRVVSLSAMAVGIGSLFIILYQTHLMRQAQHASALPYLMVTIDANQNGVHVTLSNAGIGPALIDDIRIRHHGQTIQGDPHDFYTAQRPASDSALSVNKVVPGRLIPAGTSLQMLGLNGPRAQGKPGGEFLAELLRLFRVAEVPRNWYDGVGAVESDQAVIEITYSSVYGERWRLRSDRFAPERL
jgi:hypothetical protein